MTTDRIQHMKRSFLSDLGVGAAFAGLIAVAIASVAGAAPSLARPPSPQALGVHEEKPCCDEPRLAAGESLTDDDGTATM